MNSPTGSNKLEALCYLLATQPLTPTDQTEIKTLINSPDLADNPESVIIALEAWLSHPIPTRQSLLEMYLKYTEGPESGKTFGPGGITSKTPPGQPSPTAQEQVKNALLVNSTTKPKQDPQSEQS